MRHENPINTRWSIRYLYDVAEIHPGSKKTERKSIQRKTMFGAGKKIGCAQGKYGVQSCSFNGPEIQLHWIPIFWSRRKG